MKPHFHYKILLKNSIIGTDINVTSNIKMHNCCLTPTETAIKILFQHVSWAICVWLIYTFGKCGLHFAAKNVPQLVFGGANITLNQCTQTIVASSYLHCTWLCQNIILNTHSVFVGQQLISSVEFLSNYF